MSDPKNWLMWRPTPVTYVRYSGTWDMQLLYTNMVDWFRRRKYRFHEKVYKHKTPSPFGVERQYMWEAKRAISEYELVLYEVYMHTYDAHEVDVKMKDGTTKKMTHGRIRIEMEVKVMWDWEGRWKATRFYHRLNSFYNKYIMRKRVMQGLSPKYRQEFWDFEHMVENTLNMYTGQTHAWEHTAGVHKRAL